jgi:hypothetical protein
MIRMGRESKLAPKEVIDKAIEFFGKQWGMEVTESGDCCARFEGGGGHVYVDTTSLEHGSGARVEIQGRQWERQIKEFMGEI